MERENERHRNTEIESPLLARWRERKDSPLVLGFLSEQLQHPTGQISFLI